MSNKLLATSSSIEGITKIISEYFCGAAITLIPISQDSYKVQNSNGEIKNVIVHKTKNKFKFERIIP